MNLEKLKNISSIENEDETYDLKSKICFIIMSFSGNPIIESYYELAVKPTVEKYNYRCVRIDEDTFTGLITEKIKDYINNSDLIIADLTEDKPNCYFELGYAVAKEKKFILQRLIAPGYPANFEFDVKDYPHILYKTINDLKIKLDLKIKNIV